MAKRILLFGAGKSATVLIEYLLSNALLFNWEVIVADSDINLVLSKTKNHPFAVPVPINILDDEKRKSLVEGADLVISMMPPSLHFLIAQDCLYYAKNLLTASYLNEQISSLAVDVKEKDILFLCEMGLDPGIDHMSAKKILDKMAEKNHKIISFKSHCGGLVSPDSDDNPWHYKISWNPRNVVLAGKSGADYLESGTIVHVPYGQIFYNGNRVKSLEGSFEPLNYYPNRNSLQYLELYKLSGLQTFIRTTLRHPDFISGWKKLVDLGLTDETTNYPLIDYNLKEFYQIFGAKNSIDWKEIFSAEPLFESQMNAIGFNDECRLNLDQLSAADAVQIGMEKNLLLGPDDKDMVVMVHEIEFEEEGNKKQLQSTLVVKGDDNLHTAMAKTVGLPLGIAAKLILTGQLELKGIHIPVVKEIYLPVLEELEVNGIVFKEITRENN